MSSTVQATVDPDTRTATITTRFARPIEVVWTLWSDADKLARWWGPPGVPLTVDHHDLVPGGRIDVTAHVAGSVVRGRWRIMAVDPPRSLRFTFASDGLEPTEIHVRIDPVSQATTTMAITARFASDADLHRATEIGFVEGVARACESAHEAL